MDLPQELIIEILSHLDDLQDLKNCLLISKSFKNLIIKSPRLMRRIPIHLSGDMGQPWIEKDAYVEEYGEFLRVVKMETVTFASGQEMEIFLRKIPKVEVLEMNDCVVADGQNIDCSYCSSMSALVGALMNNSNEKLAENSKKPEEQSPILTELTHLTQIKCHNTDQTLLKNLQKSARKIKSFTLDFACFPRTMPDYSPVLVQQDNLKELTLSNLRDTYNIFRAKNFTFRLKKLCIQEDFLVISDNLLDFLATHSASMLDLTISSRFMNLDLFQLISNRFSQLGRISFKLGTVTADLDCNIKRYQMHSVKSVDFETVSENSLELKAITHLFPNAEFIDFSWRSESLLSRFETTNRVPHASIEYFNYMHKLKSFKFSRIYVATENFWNEFLAKCPNIEDIRIETIGSFDRVITANQALTEIVTSLAQCKALRIFEVNMRMERLGIIARLKIDSNRNVMEISEDFHDHFKIELDILETMFKNFEKVVRKREVGVCNYQLQMAEFF